MLDLNPIARQVTALVAGVTDDQLGGPTPCPGMPVAGMLEHLRGLSFEFTRAATKGNAPGVPPPRADAANLPADWQEQLPSTLAGLGAAWDVSDAWEGETTAGGVTWPAQVMGAVALNELVIHGWDLAVSTGQAYQPDETTLRASHDFLAAGADDQQGREGIFGPVVPVDPDAPLLDRVIGLSGRNPAWRPSPA